jgi:hypothetical protein
MNREPDLDDRVRQALDPDSGTVERMVSTALQHGAAARRRPGLLSAALVTAGALACALLVLVHRGTPPAEPAGLVLTRAGDVVMIQSASGETWIVGPRRPGDVDRPAGMGFVIAEGDTK